MTKPIIAAVHGYALGGGFELALATDIIVATASAQFGITEGLVGAISGAGAVHRASRQLPLKVAMSLILTGRRMDTQEALRLGLVSELAEDREQLMVLAEKWANDILRCSPLFTRAVKAAVTAGLGWPLDVALETRYELIDQMSRSQDSREGGAAFRERRAPHWIGR